MGVVNKELKWVLTNRFVDTIGCQAINKRTRRRQLSAELSSCVRGDILFWQEMLKNMTKHINADLFLNLCRTKDDICITNYPFTVKKCQFSFQGNTVLALKENQIYTRRDVIL